MKILKIFLLIAIFLFIAVLITNLITKDRLSIGNYEVPSFNTGGGTDTTTGDGGGAGNGSRNGDSQTGNEANDFGRVGAMNHQYLQSGFERLVVEVDYAEGAKPNSSAISALLDKVNTYADKPSGIVQGGGNSFPAQKETYTTQDLANIMEQNRDNYSGGDTATLYVLYLNGEFQDGNSLGVAFAASSFAIFPDKIDDATTSLLFPSGFEKSVLIHEFGHILGLININYQSDIDHEDPEHPNHSNNKNSVMYWAVEDVSVSNVFSGGPPSEFDEADRSDIQNIKKGVY